MKCFNCGKIGHKKDNCPELFVGFDKARELFNMNESDDQVLCILSDIVCTATKENKKSVSFFDSIKKHELETLSSIVIWYDVHH